MADIPAELKFASKPNWQYPKLFSKFLGTFRENKNFTCKTHAYYAKPRKVIYLKLV